MHKISAMSYEYCMVEMRDCVVKVILGMEEIIAAWAAETFNHPFWVKEPELRTT